MEPTQIPQSSLCPQEKRVWKQKQPKTQQGILWFWETSLVRGSPEVFPSSVHPRRKSLHKLSLLKLFIKSLSFIDYSTVKHLLSQNLYLNLKISLAKIFCGTFRQRKVLFLFLPYLSMRVASLNSVAGSIRECTVSKTRVQMESKHGPTVWCILI